MRKTAFCICENKDADQLCSNREADQCLCFRYTDSTIPLLPKFIRNFKPLAILCGCAARFVSDLVGNPEDRFSHNEAQIGTALIRLHMEADLSHYWFTCTIVGFVSLCRVVICCTIVGVVSLCRVVIYVLSFTA